VVEHPDAGDFVRATALPADPTRAQATVRVNRGAATLPDSVRRVLTQPRKAGAAEAASDPLAQAIAALAPQQYG